MGSDMGTLALAGLELGWMPRRDAEAGFFFEFGTPSDPACRVCEGWRYRIGFNVRVHLREGKVIDPWGGIGVGYERLAAPHQSAYLAEWGGLVLPRFQVGIDVHVVPGLLLAPYGSLAQVMYDPQAPAWAAGGQLSVDAGLRAGYAW